MHSTKFARDALGYRIHKCPRQASLTYLIITLSFNNELIISERTKIVASPESIVVSALTTQLSFNCFAMSDDSTPIKTLWYKSLDREVMLRTYRDLRMSLDNQTLAIIPQNSSMLKNYVGNYSCVVSNGYSKDIRNFTISLLDELSSLRWFYSMFHY